MTRAAPQNSTMTATMVTLEPSPTGVPDRRWFGLLVALAMIAMVVQRGASELAMTREIGSDPQTSLSVMFMVATLGYWLLCGSVAAAVLFFDWKPELRIFLGVVLLLVWSYGISMESWNFETSKQAVAEASDPSTSPARLGQLVRLTGLQAGYDLDNRIAGNPNSSPVILKKLYDRHNLGTVMILARNPNTPENILQSIVDYDLTSVDHDQENEWIRKCLKKNPRLPESLRERLAGNKQLVGK